MIETRTGEIEHTVRMKADLAGLSVVVKLQSKLNRKTFQKRLLPLGLSEHKPVTGKPHRINSGKVGHL